MRGNRNASFAIKVGAIAATVLIVLCVAQAGPPSLQSRIDNFGCINPNLYRGAQPRASDYADLAKMGVKTVIDLQRDGERDEQRLVESAGMKFYRIGLRDDAWPTSEQARTFLKIVDDPGNQPVFIHCHGGRHRAGAMTAIYRITHDGWDANRAYAEMKQYGFEKGIGHGTLKDYVYDYYSQRKQGEVVVTTR